MRRTAVLVGRLLLVVLVAGVALAAGAWLGGWRPPTRWGVPAIHSSGDRRPHEVISDTERRSLDEILSEHGSATDN